MDTNASAEGYGRRLSSWKEIADFFGKDERTVRRWEARRGLPVRRVPGGTGATIFAYTEELSRWLDLKGVGGAAILQSADLPDPTTSAEAPEQALTPPLIASAPTSTARRTVRLSRWAVGVVFAAAVALAGLSLVATRASSPPARRSAATATAGRSRDPRAAEFYLKGVYSWNLRTPEGLTEAVDDFTQTIVLDPGFAPAYVGLANCYNLLREYSNMPPEQAYPRAEAAAERAIALDDRSAEAHRALAFDSYYWGWNIPKARREFQRAIQLDPGSPLSHQWYANFLASIGDGRSALAEIDRARALDPASSPILADKAAVLMSVGRFREAQDILQHMTLMNPNLISPHTYLSALYFDAGDNARFIHELKATAQLTHDQRTSGLADAAEHGLTASGREGMLAALEGARRASVHDGRPPVYELARIAAARRRPAEALANLEMAVQSHDPAVTGIHVGPDLFAASFEREVPLAGIKNRVHPVGRGFTRFQEKRRSCRGGPCKGASVLGGSVWSPSQLPLLAPSGRAHSPPV